MTALVTGGRGFLGRHLRRRLAWLGADVHAQSRVEVTERGTTRWWRAEVEDVAAVRRLLTTVRPDIIFHLAGRVSAAPELGLVLPTFQSLLTSTVTLLTAATEVGRCRVVLVGSLEEPDAARGYSTPSSPYGAAKQAAAAYGRMFHHLYGTPTVMVRLFMTYGPGQAPDKVIPYTIAALLRGEPPRLSAATRPLDWVYVDDAVDGLLRVGNTPGIDGSTIDIGSGVATPLRDVVAHLVDLIDPSIEPRLGAVPDRPFTGARAANAEATWQRTGWRATTPLAEGLARTVEWYRTRQPTPAATPGVTQER